MVGARDDASADAWPSSSSGGAASSSGNVIPPIEVPACLGSEGGAGTTELIDDAYPLGVELPAEHVDVSVTGSGCERTFSMHTTAPLRDALPANPRALRERPERPSLQTGNALFDALYQLALEEADENAVDSIRDYAFNDGDPVGCGAAGCFETGRKWSYVWTRDTAYAVDLGLGWVDPARALGSLHFKLSPHRDGSAPEIVQDTGTGGSYPVSTDRVAWALGAERLLPLLDPASRSTLATRALEATRNTVRRDREIAFDARDGLYRGEQSFLDWRAQSYPAWTVPDLVHIAVSKSLSTNVTHLRALRLAASLAHEAGVDNAEYTQWADALRTAIRAKLWLAADALPSTYLTTALDPAPARRFDLLGLSLAILSEVLTPEEARAALSTYPTLPQGPPVLMPQQQHTPIYHNRAIWPFVTGYWMHAARKSGHAGAYEAAVSSLVRGAARNLSNLENLELVSGRAYVEDGAASGPVVNSQRQLWSVAAYIGMVHQALFGLEPTTTGLQIAPTITAEIHREWLGGARVVSLNRVPWRGKTLSVRLHLPEVAASGAYGVSAIRINDATVSLPITAEALADANLIDVELSAPTASSDSVRRIDDVRDYRVLYAPKTPSVSVSLRDGALVVGLDRGDEAAGDVTFTVYRDGAKVADALPGTTTQWIDPDSSEAAPSYCYTIEARYASGNVSQRANPACYWGAGNARIRGLPIQDFANVGGVLVTDHGKTFYQAWGDRDHTLTGTFTADHSGEHLLSATYGNGAGPLDTGISCGVKRLRVERVSDGEVVGNGVLVMPQRGDWSAWGESSFVRASLQAGVSYRVRIGSDASTVNMTDFQHFADYTGGAGGRAGVNLRVNLAEIKLLWLGR